MLEYYSTIQLNDVVLACNTWMNLKSVTEQQQPDTRVHKIPLCKIQKYRKLIYDNRNQYSYR